MDCELYHRHHHQHLDLGGQEQLGFSSTSLLERDNSAHNNNNNKAPYTRFSVNSILDFSAQPQNNGGGSNGLLDGLNLNHRDVSDNNSYANLIIDCDKSVGSISSGSSSGSGSEGKKST